MVRTPEEIRAALREELLAAFAAEYQFVVETWKMLESKAQVSVTVNGVFFAAAFAYARETLPPSAPLRVLLVVTLLLLLASVSAALLSLRIARVSVPPLGTFSEVIVSDLTRLGDADLGEEVVGRAMGDHVTQWREAVRAANDVNAEKAKYVLRSQVLLGMAMAGAAVFTIVRVIS